jgi:hypothetical protein
LSKILKYSIIFGLTSIVILYAINIQNFNSNVINQIFAKDEPSKDLQIQSNSSTISNAQTYGMGSPFMITKTPSSNAETNVIQGGVSGSGSEITGPKIPSSNAETNGGYNPINPTNTNCSSDPRLLIACTNIPSSNTNCGINPQAPPCCVESTSDKSCNKSTNPTNTNCSSDPRLLIACINIPSSNTNCGINPQAPPCCVEPTSDKSCIQMKKADVSNINTNPQNVHVGQQFKIKATITNNLNSPIKFVGNVCGTSPLNIEFDNNVQIQNTNTCQAISFTTLNPNDTTTVQGSGGTIFTASNPGTTNAKIAFNYNTEGDKQDSTTKSFTFEILP